MNKLRTLFVTCVFFMGISSPGFADSSPYLKTGETLTYSAFFNFIPAGSATLSVLSTDTLSGVPVSHVRYQVKTRGMADRIFKVRDKIDIWLNSESFETYKVKKSIREGTFKKTSEAEFNYKDSTAVCDGDTLALTTTIRTPYSLLYYFRSLPLMLGQIIDVFTMDNKNFSEFQVMVEGKENISIPAGEYSCFILKPFREGKALLKNQGDMVVWLSDDEHRYPVQIQVKMKYGSMFLKLKSVKNEK